MKILVTGCKGQLGSEINKISVGYTNYNWIFTDLDELDLSDLDLLEIKLKNISPDLIINCAAYTDVDKAENNFKIANTINNLSVGVISNFSKKYNCKLIHVSTDYVFDGNCSTPLNENSITNPINTYGKTKLLGEQLCFLNNPESIIIRTSWVYSSFGNNFVKKMVDLMKSNDEINVVNDQIGSPTYAYDLANIILLIVDSNKWSSGLYHFSNDGEISWFEFARSIRNIYGFKTKIIGVSSKEFFTVAKRPKYSLLDKSKISKTYNVKIPDYFISLKRCLNIINNENEI